MRRQVAVRVLASAILAGICTSSGALGQAISGGLQGTVTDLTGAVVPGASIGLLSQTLPRGIDAVTDQFGRYIFGSLAAGQYTVTVSAPGFHTLRYHNLEITLGSQSTFNARLSLGAVTESIEINDSLISVDTASSRTLTHITASEFGNLARGRSFHTLLMMAPGV